MDKELYLPLKEDLKRLIPIVARRNRCYNDDVVKVMGDIYAEYSNNG